ncbi:50S ribosomal protein L32 [Cellulomonas bogoriensis]|uniref:Large ribosomal subunit protein bL32 n=1 Tax=Cellulomonas bogoriensis 69B4 = DSM 16987 TaxID=1386082 RepID=A0A0A0C2V6_9CELL|nr:50S ribosomal protein L32 [Cellulomonas bogoriensis]KGM14516.1 50S ribosomal protein L32 [Cellulomonas bogoriensis 69B4 = DSM 16987]
MAVPKRKMSRSRTRSRRAQWKATPTELVTVRAGGREVQVPRRLVRAVQRGLVDPDTL